MIDNCFHDPDVLELVRKHWQNQYSRRRQVVDGVHVVTDRYGNRIHLLRLPARGHAWFVSPYQAGIELARAAPTEIRADNLFDDLVDRLLALVMPYRNVRLEVRIPGWFFKTHPYALLEPFLRAGFDVSIDRWQRVVDLRANAEEILAGCAPTVRRRIREGQRAAVKWRSYYAEPVPESVFRELFEASKRTREASGGELRHPVDYFVGDRRRLVESGKAALTILEHEQSRHYLFTLVSHELGCYVDGAWTGPRNDFGNHSLHYRTIVFLKDLGCVHYVLGNVFPDLRSRKQKAQGIARFKHGLGTELSPTYSVILEPRTRLSHAYESLVARVAHLRQIAGRVRRRITSRHRRTRLSRDGQAGS